MNNLEQYARACEQLAVEIAQDIEKSRLTAQRKRSYIEYVRDGMDAEFDRHYSDVGVCLTAANLARGVYTGDE